MRGWQHLRFRLRPDGLSPLTTVVAALAAATVVSAMVAATVVGLVGLVTDARSTAASGPERSATRPVESARDLSRLTRPRTSGPTRPRPQTMVAAVPLPVSIPSIDIDSALMDLGLNSDGTLEVPPGAFPAGWFLGAPTPGELGPAIIVGHVDWAGEPGVFFDLHLLTRGDVVTLARADGSSARLQVTRVARFAKDEFPTTAVYGDIDHAGLRLITCGGEFDLLAGSYRDNIVVFAELVGRDDPPIPGASPSIR
jgi:hypothetical protein